MHLFRDLGDFDRNYKCFAALEILRIFCDPILINAYAKNSSSPLYRLKRISDIEPIIPFLDLEKIPTLLSSGIQTDPDHLYMLLDRNRGLEAVSVFLKRYAPIVRLSQGLTNIAGKLTYIRFLLPPSNVVRNFQVASAAITPISWTLFAVVEFIVLIRTLSTHRQIRLLQGLMENAQRYAPGNSVLLPPPAIQYGLDQLKIRRSRFLWDLSLIPYTTVVKSYHFFRKESLHKERYENTFAMMIGALVFKDPLMISFLALFPNISILDNLEALAELLNRMDGPEGEKRPTTDQFHEAFDLSTRIFKALAESVRSS